MLKKLNLGGKKKPKHVSISEERIIITANDKVVKKASNQKEKNAEKQSSKQQNGSVNTRLISHQNAINGVQSKQQQSNGTTAIIVEADSDSVTIE